MTRWIFRATTAAFFAFPAAALAAAAAPSPTLAFPTDQVVAALVGALAPVVGYVLNRLVPRASEAVRGTVVLALAAGGGALYTAIFVSHVHGFRTYLQLVVSAVVGAIVSHHGVLKPMGLNVRLSGRAGPQALGRTNR